MQIMQKSEEAVTIGWVLKFSCDGDLLHIAASQCKTYPVMLQ